MVWMGFLVVGAILGAVMARRRGGRKLDMLQYAAGFGIAFGLVGVAVSILLVRLF